MAYAADFEQVLADCRGQGAYDCLVAIRGGKDSIYLLHRLKVDYQLKVLASIGDVNIPALAWDNIRRALVKLDIDHFSYSPSHGFYEKTFCYLMRNLEERGTVYTVSHVYAPLFEEDAIRMVIEKGIPLVPAGYSPGQPESERMLYEFSRQLIREAGWSPPAARRRCFRSPAWAYRRRRAISTRCWATTWKTGNGDSGASVLVTPYRQ